MLGLDATARRNNVDNLKSEMSLLDGQLKDFNMLFEQKKLDSAAQIAELQESMNSKNLLFVQKKIQLINSLALVPNNKNQKLISVGSL